MQPSEEVQQFYEQALAYDEAGDVYNAAKLYKRVIQLDAQWPLPYFRLRTIYKHRREWKPTYHYAKRALALDPACSDTWWDLGIAATALKKWRIAKNVWSKFNLPSAFSKKSREVCSLFLENEKQFELIWVRPLCPARAEIISIPQAASQLCYKDIVLYDRLQLKGHNIAGNRKLPVFAFLGHWKRSNYETFSCQLYTSREKDIQTLELLCHQTGCGFENWSNSALNFSPGIREGVPEFYNVKKHLDHSPAETQWVAIAARNQHRVERMLQQWRLISLNDYDNLQRHV